MFIATFKNARTTILAEDRCKSSNLKVSVIATPSDISSECGMSLRIDDDYVGDFKTIMSDFKIECNIYERG